MRGLRDHGPRDSAIPTGAVQDHLPRFHALVDRIRSRADRKRRLNRELLAFGNSLSLGVLLLSDVCPYHPCRIIFHVSICKEAGRDFERIKYSVPACGFSLPPLDQPRIPWHSPTSQKPDNRPEIGSFSMSRSDCTGPLNLVPVLAWSLPPTMRSTSISKHTNAPGAPPQS